MDGKSGMICRSTGLSQIPWESIIHWLFKPRTNQIGPFEPLVYYLKDILALRAVCRNLYHLINQQILFLPFNVYPFRNNQTDPNNNEYRVPAPGMDEKFLKMIRVRTNWKFDCLYVDVGYRGKMKDTITFFSKYACLVDHRNLENVTVSLYGDRTITEMKEMSDVDPNNPDPEIVRRRKERLRINNLQTRTRRNSHFDNTRQSVISQSEDGVSEGRNMHRLGAKAGGNKVIRIPDDLNEFYSLVREWPLYHAKSFHVSFHEGYYDDRFFTHFCSLAANLEYLYILPKHPKALKMLNSLVQLKSMSLLTSDLAVGDIHQLVNLKSLTVKSIVVNEYDADSVYFPRLEYLILKMQPENGLHRVPRFLRNCLPNLRKLVILTGLIDNVVCFNPLPPFCSCIVTSPYLLEGFMKCDTILDFSGFEYAFGGHLTKFEKLPRSLIVPCITPDLTLLGGSYPRIGGEISVERFNQIVQSKLQDCLLEILNHFSKAEGLVLYDFLVTRPDSTTGLSTEEVTFADLKEWAVRNEDYLKTHPVKTIHYWPEKIHRGVIRLKSQPYSAEAQEILSRFY